MVHTASPFVLQQPDNPEDLVKPAVEGTRAVLEACKEFGVKRLVITSSTASVTNKAADKWPQADNFDETCWTDLDRPEGVSHYVRSKTLAEQAAWDF